MTHDTLASRLRHFADRPVARWTAAVIGVAALIGAISMVISPAAPEANDGSVLQIALRAAPEPVYSPGDVMSVGALTDRLDRDALARSEAAQREAEAREQAHLAEFSAQTYDDGYPPGAFPAEYREQARVTLTPPPRPEDPVRREFGGRPLSFGFDTPRPDYVAEREARMTERDARMVRRYSSSGETTYAAVE